MFGAGHETPQRGGTLKLWDENRVRSLDPHIAHDEVSGLLIEMMFDSLYAYDEQMNIVPRLAAALPEISEDGKTFRVRLRQGVRFHHGRELRASDVVWSFERVLDPKTHSPGATYYALIEGVEDFQSGKSPHISGIREEDPYQVAFVLKSADQSFVHTLALRFASPVPREIVKERGAEFAQRPVGVGPFRFGTWDSGVRLVVERFPNYFRKGLPYLDRVVFEEGLDKDTAFLRFRNGEVDIAQRINVADIRYLKSSAWKPYTRVSPRVDMYGLGMNTEMPPFDNVHVRRAVAFALDRERWAKARNFIIRPTGQLLPPSIAGYDPKLPNEQRFDLARAREEMRLAGYPNGLDKPVTIWGTANETMRKYLALAQADLEKIGIKLEMKLVSFPVWLEQTGTPKTAQMFGGGWSMDYPDPSNFLNIVSSKTKTAKNSYNRTFYSDPSLDALLDRALVERDPQKRVAMYREANDFVAREAPWAFFCNQQLTHAFQPYVRDYRPHPAHWVPVNEVWLDLPKKRVAGVRKKQLFGSRYAALSPFGGVP